VDPDDGKLWKQAMVEEMEALEKNEAWDLVELLTRRNPIDKKGVFKKLNAKGKMEKYKAHLVEKGYSRLEGIDFGEIFSLVTKLNSIRFILSVSIVFCFEVK
jgi:hypothetical protein